ncbi:hypothetical protein Taro_021347 [Colocasia esculenta]|uniref:Signal recognition particle subunit SRP72 n=1 Tax=Colocasia esculenta TaxID=4460 RepID=A0A843UYS9_COLES|nr:hypothetical protein [Colocasia esculenta]
MVLQLESQILYRLGRMDACVESCEKLQKLKVDSLDLKTNMVAALISAGRVSEVQRMMDALKVKPSSSFELAYNTACSLIEKKQYADAEKMLLSARRIGQEMLMEEDYLDDEIENELAPIAVQLAYVKQLLGHTQEALEFYAGIINRKLADVSSIAVATNNLIAVRGTKDISDGLRKLDQLVKKGDSKQHFHLANGLDFKLFSRQKEAIYSNRVLLLLHANKLGQAQELVSALSVMFPESVSPVLLQAAVFVKAKNIPKAEEILGQFADRFPDKSKPVLLARAQIAAVAGHAKISAESLARIPDMQHMPASVATLISLRERCNDVDGATEVLDSAVEWWKNSMAVDNKDTLDVIMHEAASFKLKHGREKEAAQLYEELFRSHESVEALAGLVTTAARTDPEKAEAYEKKLRALPGLKGINVENLEKTSGAKHTGGAQLGKVEVPEAVKEKTRKKKRKRKPRYPKGFDPANPGPQPDPERWLPRRERSTYRPKRKDKRHQVRGSQGAVLREKHDTPATANANSTSGPKPGHPGAGSSKGASQSSTGSSEQARTSSSKSRKKSRS